MYKHIQMVFDGKYRKFHHVYIYKPTGIYRCFIPDYD